MKPLSRSKIIYVASDHAGYQLKQKVINYLNQEQIRFAISQIVDLGCESDSISVDYPDYANKLAYIIGEQNDCKKSNPQTNENPTTLKNVSYIGILICGSGIGISIAANRFHKIRAALCHNVKTAKLARQHNDANVLCLGARIIKSNTALNIVKTFINNNFLGDRHESRVKKLAQQPKFKH